MGKWDDFRKQNIPTGKHYKTPVVGLEYRLPVLEYSSEKTVIALHVVLFFRLSAGMFITVLDRDKRLQ